MSEPVPVSPGHFRCGNCRRMFPKGRSEAETLAEMRGNFGDLPPGNQAVLCDACRRKFMAWLERGAR